MAVFGYVTLLSSDDYYLGCIMLNLSLKKVRSNYPLFVICRKGLSDSTLEELTRQKLQYIILEDHWENPEGYNQETGYEHWGNTFDKLYIWTLTQFDKVVYLDSDMQVIRNIDYLFNQPHMSAVRADEWNDPSVNHLNSGLMVIEPNIAEFESFKSIWGGQLKWWKNIGDQDIIRAAFPDWGDHRELTLPYGLNVFYSEVSHGVIKEEQVTPISVIHYIGNRKPWMLSPRAFWRRSRHNFLGKYLLQYALVLWLHFPNTLFSWAQKMK